MRPSSPAATLQSCSQGNCAAQSRPCSVAGTGWTSILGTLLRLARRVARVTGACRAPAMSTAPAWSTVTEGSAQILLPAGQKDVFYNPAQVVNRDLSVAALTAYNDLLTEQGRTTPLTVIEALSATGLRSLRYAKECPNIGTIIANDLDRGAVESIERNIAHNAQLDGNDCDYSRIKVRCSDANAVMAEHHRGRDRVDIVDLDPYGSANNFIEAALKALRSGGLLCVTCTDIAVLAGSKPMQCQAKYGAMPLRARYCHEMALRIVLSFVSQIAARHGLVIEPLASAHIDFYVRLFIRVRKSQQGANDAIKKLGSVWQCSGCESFQVVPAVQPKSRKANELTQAHAPDTGNRCKECDSVFKMGGLWWMAPMNDVAFLARLQAVVSSPTCTLATRTRLQGMLDGLQGELHDVPLFMCLASMCHTVHCEQPPAQRVRSALINAGYRVSRSHTLPTAIKTDAPLHVVWDVIRHWVRERPVKKADNENAPGYKILSRDMRTEVDCTIVPESAGVGKYPSNPTENWGPMARAKRGAPAVSPAKDDGLKKTRVDEEVAA